MNIRTQFDLHSKILIIGTSGSGKTTLAKFLAQKYHLADIELDALYWEKNWQGTELSKFREKIITAQEEASNLERGFVMHGNYNKVRDLTWGKAETIIWLDYSKWITMWRVISRSISRVLKREPLWEGNKESFSKTFLSRESIILWAWNTYSPRKIQYEELIASGEYSMAKIIRFKKPKECRKFLFLCSRD